ncbi:hypothetical protein [Rubrolithibacter danxiaensis]|uniref:hypothetical protein n=1 Tax=Rubrolithibacter danxiaensis TaxID=3390805 RepID=UPI003BF8D9EB
MATELIRISTPEGPVTLNKSQITAIEPIEEGTKIQLESPHYSSKLQSFISNESYDNVVMLYFSV